MPSRSWSAAGIVREFAGRVGGAIRYDFSHGRLRDATYEATSLARRRLLHRRTAEALRRGRSAAAGHDDDRWHVLIAVARTRGRTVLVAASRPTESAAKGRGRFANREAIEHLDAALALGNPDASSAHARIGELRSRLGEYPEPSPHSRRRRPWRRRGPAGGDRTRLGRVDRRRGDLSAAASHLESALGSSGLDPTTRLARRARRAKHHRVACRRPRTRPRAPAPGRAARAGDPRRRGWRNGWSGWSRSCRGDLGAARAALDRSARRPPATRTRRRGSPRHGPRAGAVAADGAVDEAVVSAERVAACRRIGDRHLEAAVENHLADLLHEAGREATSRWTTSSARSPCSPRSGSDAPEREPGMWALAAW